MMMPLFRRLEIRVQFYLLFFTTDLPSWISSGLGSSIEFSRTEQKPLPGKIY